MAGYSSVLENEEKPKTSRERLPGALYPKIKKRNTSNKGELGDNGTINKKPKIQKKKRNAWKIIIRNRVQRRWRVKALPVYINQHKESCSTMDPIL